MISRKYILTNNTFIQIISFMEYRQKLLETKIQNSKQGENFSVEFNIQYYVVI